MKQGLNTDRINDFFEGTWLLERNIYIKQSGLLHAGAIGKACFNPRPDDDRYLDYLEKGKLRMVSAVSDINFSRKFTYQSGPTGRMDVYFADGPDNGSLYQRYLFEMPDKFIAAQIHVCGSDHYKGVYHFYDSNSFELTTEIAGNTKDFLIKTVYSRQLI